MTIESFLKSGPSLANILYTTNPEGDEIDDISCCAWYATFFLNGGFGDMTSKESDPQHGHM